MKRTNVIFLLGCSQAGKDTVGEVLIKNYNFQRISFADALKKEMADRYGLDEKLLSIQGEYKEAHRPLMIEVAERERAKDPLCWMKKALSPYIDESIDPLYGIKDDLNLVITDCRRDAEIDWIYNFKKEINDLESESEVHYLNVELWYIQRDEAEQNDPDVLTHYCIGYAKGLHRAANGFNVIDAIIKNNATEEALRNKLKQKVEMTLSKIFI